MSKKISSILNEQGFLHKEGKEIVDGLFNNRVNHILNLAENENELRQLGSVISKIIGDIVSYRVSELNKYTITSISMDDSFLAGDDFVERLEKVLTEFKPMSDHAAKILSNGPEVSGPIETLPLDKSKIKSPAEVAMDPPKVAMDPPNMPSFRNNEVEIIILQEIQKSGEIGCMPQDIHAKFVAHGINSGAIRDAISKLWDCGEIKLGTDRRLRLNYDVEIK